MAKQSILKNLYDPRAGGQAIRVQIVPSTDEPVHPVRTNYFSIYLIREGMGTFWADASQFEFRQDSLLFFVPYQHIQIVPSQSVCGDLIQFHANFLCVETFHAEAGCSGTLFNDPYGGPAVELDKRRKRDVIGLIERIRQEQVEPDLASSDVMLAYLKVLLILAARLKTKYSESCAVPSIGPRHPTLVELRELIEAHYQTWHSPADYAQRLHLTPKTLGRIVREQLGTTPTDLIRNRILIHAKWQLLHTLRPVKEISRELGFSDELYFSRLFKKATGYSPSFFREFETEIRGGSNLSMLSDHAPILHSVETVDS
ncbi:helix-turn-helix domain-containing protein [Schlesneria paludicola]|uniref:helix-turn-helix domain-containing protein n=1 Tax=Schlesneria paludicola TaxID=360056 RepID=UPI00029A4529|nr:AraC family transcriptional regulator [Schlesneria paludicola]